MTGDKPWRIRAATSDDIQDLLMFCAAHEVVETGVDAPRALQRLVSSPRYILDLYRGDQRAAVGALLDKVAVAGAMPFELLGCRFPVLPADAMPFLFDWLISSSQSYGGDLILDLTPCLCEAKALLVAHGFTCSHSSYLMQSTIAGSIPAAPLPAGYGWVDYAVSHADELYALVQRAFGAESGAGVPAKDDFLVTLGRKSIPPRLLMRGHSIAGYVTLSRDDKDPTLGHINLLARHPDLKGVGLGSHLMSGAVERLKQAGAARFSLEASSRNVNALKLYRGFGFDIVRQVDVYRGRFHAAAMPRSP